MVVIKKVHKQARYFRTFSKLLALYLPTLGKHTRQVPVSHACGYLPLEKGKHDKDLGEVLSSVGTSNRSVYSGI